MEMLDLELEGTSARYKESQYHPEQQTIEVKLIVSHLRVSGESFLNPRCRPFGATAGNAAATTTIDAPGPV